MRRVLGFGLALSFLVPPAWAGDTEPKSPEKPPEKPAPPAEVKVPGPFRSFNVSGARTGKFHDPVTAFSLDPVIAVIARAEIPKGESSLGKLLAGAETLILARKADRLAGWGAFLTLKNDLPFDEERDAPLKALDNLAKDAKLEQFALGIAKAEDPAGKLFAIGPDTEVVVLLYNRFHIKERYVFTKDKPLTDEAVATILKQAEAMLPPLPPPRRKPGKPKVEPTPEPKPAAG